MDRVLPMCIGLRHMAKLADVVHFLTGPASGKTENQPSSGCAFLFSLWWPNNKRIQGKKDLGAQFQSVQPLGTWIHACGQHATEARPHGRDFLWSTGSQRGNIGLLRMSAFYFYFPLVPSSQDRAAHILPGLILFGNSLRDITRRFSSVS